MGINTLKYRWSRYFGTSIGKSSARHLNKVYNYFMSYSFDADFIDPYFLDEEVDLQKIRETENFVSGQKLANSSDNVLLSYVPNCNFADDYRLKNLNELKSILKSTMTFAGQC